MHRHGPKGPEEHQLKKGGEKMRGFRDDSPKAMEPIGGSSIRTPNSIERVNTKIKIMREELEALEEMANILEKNPDIQRLLTLMDKVHF